MENYCSECGSKLENGLCPNCKNINKKKKKFPVWGIVLIIIGSILFGLLMLMGIIFFFVKTISLIENTRINLDWNSYNYGTVNSTINGSNMDITLDDFETREYLVKDNGDYIYPSDGREFIIFSMEIKNTSAHPYQIYYNNFVGFVQNKVVNPLIITDKIDEYDVIGDTTLSYLEYEGEVIFEVDKNWDMFFLTYYDYLQSGFTFIATNKEKEDNLIPSL